jgi:hypothetical protein
VGCSEFKLHRVPRCKAKAGWNDNAADPEGEEVEPDGYNDAYAAKTSKDDGEDEE